MRLTEKQSREMLEKHGAFLRDVCDKCGMAIHSANRFTRFGETGVWCSRECRDGKSRVPAIREPRNCSGCGVTLSGKRKGAIFCSETCRQRFTKRKKS